MPKVKCSYKPCGKRVEREEAIRNAVQSWCSSECQFNHAMDTREKLKQEKEKKEKSDNRRRKKEFYAKDKKHQIERCQSSFNELVRLLDRGEPCISCGKPDNGEHQRHASHFKSVGANSFLRFNALNVHSACAQCNVWLSGNLIGYEEGLISKYGVSVVGFLKCAPRIKEWDIEELRHIYEEVKRDAGRIKGGGAPLREWRALFC
jgi:hypothetical protein